MTAPSRIILIAGALLALAALLVWQWRNDKPADRIGMTETPCAENGGPVTGKLRDDWPRLCAYRKLNEQLRESGEKPAVVMIGDSITVHWQIGNKAIVNRGIGGQTSAQLMLRFQQDAAALKPQAVHILVGINDIAGNAGPVSPDMVEDNIRAMVEMAQAQGIAVILGTVTPARGHPWKPRIDPDPWIGILNRWITQYAEEKNLVLADYHAALTGGDGKIRGELFYDSVHPNEAGYAVMEPVLFEALDRAGLKGLDEPISAGAAPADGDS